MAQYGVVAAQKPAGAITLAIGANYQQVVGAAPAGSTFWFESGTHRGVTIQPKDGDVFLGAPGAVLNGSELITSFTKSGTAWVIADQTQEGVRHATDESAAGAERGGYPETVFVDDKPLTPVDALSKLKPGSFYFDYAADRIYLGSDPTGHKVETGHSASAFGGTADDVTVSNLTVEKYNAPAQASAIDGGSGQGWTIQHNEIRLNYGVGANVGANGKILGNYVHDNGEMGLDAGGANVLIQGNEIARNGFWSGIDVFWEGGGGKFTETTNLQVLDNYSHDNHGFGLWTDIDNTGTLYAGNLVTNNDGGGINHEISYDAIIRNNTLIGNGAADQGDGNWLWGGQVQIQNSGGVQIYGNYVDYTKGGVGIGLIQQDRGSGAYGAHTTTDNSVHDNVLIDDTGTGITGGAADYDEAGLLDGGNTFANNHYFGTDGEGFWWGDTNSFADFAAGTRETGTLAPAAAEPAAPDLGLWLSTGSATPAPVPTPAPAPTNPAPTPPAPASPAPAAGPDIAGNGRADTLTGTSGGETISGFGGNDTLTGGAGNDWLIGGAGNDRFVFGKGFGKDTIQDFYAEGRGANHDVLVFGHDVFKDFADVMAHAVTVGGNTVITHGTDQLTVVDTVKTEFHSDHILFV